MIRVACKMKGTLKFIAALHTLLNVMSYSTQGKLGWEPFSAHYKIDLVVFMVSNRDFTY
jgi:hypothetical protein